MAVFALYDSCDWKGNRLQIGSLRNDRNASSVKYVFTLLAWPPLGNTGVHSHSFIYSFNQVQFSVSPCLLGEAALTFTQFHHTILCICSHKSRVWTFIWVWGTGEAPLNSREGESTGVADLEPGCCDLPQLLIQTLISPTQTLAKLAQCRLRLVMQTDQ